MTKRILLLFIVLSLLAFTSGCGILEELELLFHEETHQPSGMLEVHFIDVGQGDAIWIRTAQGENLLIDAGGNKQGDRVAAYLREQGVTELKAVVGTHPHEDHIGGLDVVIDNFLVEKVYMPKVVHNTKTFEDVLDAIERKNLKISTAKAGVSLELEGIQAEFIAPVSDSYKELNNYSAVLRLQYGNQVFLFTGDAEKLSEEEMLSTYSKSKLRANLLKVGHHGSSTSTSEEWLDAVNPQIGVILCGKNNTYGHPHQETLKALEDREIDIYRTDEMGTLVFYSDGGSIGVKEGGSQ